MKPALDKYTHRGTERVIKRPEPQTPTEGFCDLLGDATFDALVAAARGDVQVEPFTFLKRTPELACGFVQAGPRRIFFSLRLADPAAILCYGCDPVFATPPNNRVDYSFEPLIDPQWSFQMRHEVQQRFNLVRDVHDRQAVGMNIALHFGRYPLRARRTWEAYAAKHGLKIVEKEVSL